MDNPLVSVLVIVFGLLIDVINGDYCWYVHEDYYIRQTTYCSSGCCRDYGDEDEICCFEWTVGIILGICFAVVTVVAILIALIICCIMAKKKRARTGVLMGNNSQPYTTQNTVLYSGSTTIHPYSYPHPPSGFYPASQFPNSAPQPIQNTGTFDQGQNTNLPSFPPSSSQGGQPPSYSQVMPPSYTQATAPPGNPELYGGYGKGVN